MNMRIQSIHGKRLLSLGVGCLLAASWVPSGAQAITDEELERELQYVDGLNALRLYDYASEVLKTIPPDPRVKVRIITSSIIKGEFDKVKGIIAKEPNQNGPDTWAMKLALADGYYAWSMYPEAKGIYSGFFKLYEAGPPATLKRFYLDSAYKYAQMLMLIGDDRGAANAYRLGLKGKPERHIERQFSSELAELLVKLGIENPQTRANDFAEAEEICDKILWVQDLWFGKAIVMKAHMMMANGKTDEAMKMIEDYTSQLTAIDEALKAQSVEGHDMTKLSPMAECRYLMGAMLQEEAEKILDAGGSVAKATELLAGRGALPGKGALPGAIQHFVNVFIRYPTTPWAPDAGRRARDVKEMLMERCGKRNVEWDATPEQWDKVEKSQFMEATALYGQNQFKQAAEAYVTVLNLFPEGANALTALSNLANCYIVLKDDLYAELVVRHIAERFNMRPDVSEAAGSSVLRIAAKYDEQGRPDRKEELYKVFFDNFKKHPQTAALLYKSGDDLMNGGDIENALVYFQRVATEHADSPLSYNALNKIAKCYELRDEKVEQVKALRTYIKKLEARDRPGHPLIAAKYHEAGALRDLGPKFLPAAFRAFAEIIRLLSENPALYFQDAREKDANQQMLEAAMFYRGTIYTKLPPPEDKPAIYYKVQAIKAYNLLIEKCPQSAFAPATLSQIGMLWTLLNKPEEAEKTLRQLQAQYPESNEAKNALFLLGMSLLEMNERDRSVKIFKQMFGDQGGNYSAGQLLTAGTELLKAKEYEISLQAFERVLAMSQEPSYLQRSLLGKGKALVELGKFAEGTKPLEELYEKFPNIKLTVEGSLYLSKAYSESAIREPDGDKRFDLFNKAITSLKRVRSFDTSDKSRVNTNVRGGEILELKMQAEEKMGSPEKAKEYRQEAIGAYQTLLMFENPAVAELRPGLENAYHRCMPLLLDAENWDDVVDDTTRYFEIFPNGKYILDMRKWQGKAIAKRAASGATAAPARETDATETETPEPATAPAAAPEPAEATGEEP